MPSLTGTPGRHAHLAATLGRNVPSVVLPQTTRRQPGRIDVEVVAPARRPLPVGQRAVQAGEAGVGAVEAARSPVSCRPSQPLTCR